MAIRIDKDIEGKPYYVGHFAYGSNHIRKEGSDELLVVNELLQIGIKYKLDSSNNVVVTGSVAIPFYGNMVFYKDDTAVHRLNSQVKNNLFFDLVDLYQFFYK